MADDSDTIRNGFVRQRRTLIGTSVALFLYEKLGIVIDSINILGNTAHITDPSSVAALLWVAWGYFLWRYYQYFRDLGNKGFHNAYHGKLSSIAGPRARKQFERWLLRNKEKEFPGAIGPLRIEFRQVSLIRNSWRYWELNVDVEVFFDAKEPNVGVAPISQNLKNRRVQLFWPELIWPRIRSGWHVLVHTRLVTEYLGPFAIGLLPVLSRLTR